MTAFNNKDTIATSQADIARIAAEQTVFQELPPEINVKRKVCIVYNKDSMSSTIAASLIKRIVVDRLPEEAAMTYEFTYKEIGSLYVNAAFDAFLWIGVEMTPAAVAPDFRGAFTEAVHYISTDRTLGSTREASTFDDELARYQDRSGLPMHIVFENQSEILSRPRGQGIYFGMILHSLCSFSDIVQELRVNDFDRLISLVSDCQQDIMDFYTTHISAKDIMRAYSTMQGALKTLGQPYKDLEGLTSDEALLLYIDDFRQTRNILEQNVELQRAYYNRTSVLVMVSRMADNFWLARRVLSMAFRRFYNYRLADHGLQVTTNIPDNAQGINTRVG